jgi:cupin superfamily acireductone dioxygenase involved in methionine salvage
VKPYPKPQLKEDGIAAQSEAAAKIEKLEQALQDAKSNSFAQPILEAMAQEITGLKETLPKTGKQNQANGARLTQLQHRLQVADTAAASAAERHKQHVAALEKEIQQLQAIREHKIQDFVAAQKAFASRVVEDKQSVSELMANLGTLVQEPTEAVGDPATTPVPVDFPIEDVYRRFTAAHADVPSLKGNLCPQETQLAGEMWGFFASLTDFETLPPMTFHALGIFPSSVHSMVGDKIWGACWGEQKDHIAQEHYIPQILLEVIRYVMTQPSLSPDGLRSQAYIAPGLDRLNRVKETHTAYLKKAAGAGL